jgi:hypothetical protein
MANLRFAKVVSALPGTLVANTIYAVRVDEGFDLYVTDMTGAVAHNLNAKLALSGLGSIASRNITIGTTAPASPAVGDIWVDTN